MYNVGSFYSTFFVMLLRYIGSDTLASVETGFGSESISVAPGDIIQVHPNTDLEEKYPSLFTRFTQFWQTLQKKITVSSAEILAINTTEKELIATPWVGYVIVPESFVFFYDYNSAAYATNTTLEVRYTDKTGAKVTADVTGLIDATADDYALAQCVASLVVPVPNSPIILTAATGDPVTGDSPVYVTINYKIIQL